MSKVYHILNGDALKERFPNSLEGETIICREAMIDGDVRARNLGELYIKRESYLSSSYRNETNISYQRDVVSEFQKIQTIPDDAEINLWFEYDLFCQSNCWFVFHLLKNPNINMVLPNNLFNNGFGGISKQDLKRAYGSRIRLQRDEIVLWKQLWPAFQNKDLSKMEDLAAILRYRFGFLLECTKAFERMLNGNLIHTCDNILKSQKKKEFTHFFHAFCKEEPIFGFGDLQLKKIYDELIINV